MPTIGMGTWHHGPREEIDAALRYIICIISLDLRDNLRKKYYRESNLGTNSILGNPVILMNVQTRISVWPAIFRIFFIGVQGGISPIIPCRVEYFQRIENEKISILYYSCIKNK